MHIFNRVLAVMKSLLCIPSKTALKAQTKRNMFSLVFIGFLCSSSRKEAIKFAARKSI